MLGQPLASFVLLYKDHFHPLGLVVLIRVKLLFEKYIMIFYNAFFYVIVYETIFFLI